MTDPSEWTPEARAIREAQREGARKALLHLPSEVAEAQVDALFPPPSPAYTYGRCLTLPGSVASVRRRSDGAWKWQWSKHTSTWEPWAGMSDADAQALAAEVPLTDSQCTSIIRAVLDYRDSRGEEHIANLRRTVQHVLRGEVK